MPDAAWLAINRMEKLKSMANKSIFSKLASVVFGVLTVGALVSLPLTASASDHEAKCSGEKAAGEAKCSGEKAAPEAKCSGEKKAADAKCSADKKAADAKCSADKKPADAKCSAGKCGAGKCGESKKTEAAPAAAH